MKPVCIDPVSPYQRIVPLWGERGKQGMRNGIGEISTSPRQERVRKNSAMTE